MVNQDDRHSSDLYTCLPRKGLYPPDVELLPFQEGITRSHEVLLAVPDCNDLFVEFVIATYVHDEPCWTV